MFLCDLYRCGCFNLLKAADFKASNDRLVALAELDIKHRGKRKPLPADLPRVEMERVFRSLTIVWTATLKPQCLVGSKRVRRFGTELEIIYPASSSCFLFMDNIQILSKFLIAVILRLPCFMFRPTFKQ